MRRTNYLIASILSLMTLSNSLCQSQSNEHSKSTPGCVPINETLLCDVTEITNFSWLEYQFWTKKAFGEDSEEYKNTIISQDVWSMLACGDSLKADYLKHPAYRNFPLVGVTQEQAKNYSQWRSDRVFEYHLIKDGEIEFLNNQPIGQHFTIEKYFKGEFFARIGDSSNFEDKRIVPNMDRMYPDYRLPTQDERILILDYIDSTDFIYHQKRAKEYKNWRNNNLPFHLAIAPCDDSLAFYPTRSVDNVPFKKNKFQLIRDSRGNVAEWSAAKDTTYGGGWSHNVEYVMKNDMIYSETANPWTGFRNVCSWKNWNATATTESYIH